MVRTVFAPCLVSLLIASLTLPLFRRLANRFDILDYPSSPLKRHEHPIPYLGGAAVFAGLLAGILVYPGVWPTELIGLLCGTTVMFFVGFADDLKPLSPYSKFGLQLLATTLAILGDLHVSIAAFPPALNYFLTYLWVMAITNAFNIIDVHDGLCSGTAVFVSVGLLLVSIFTTLYDKTFVTVSAAAMAGAAAAFFAVNRPPAKMFLGDAGSLTIGFLLSGLAIGESYTPDHLVGLLVPFILFLVPIYDLIFVVIVRLAKGKSPIRGSPDHVAIRLRRLGWNDHRVLWSILSLSAAAAILCPGVVFLPLPYATFLAACAVLACIGIGIVLAGVKTE